jgi:hypothetical protein
MQRSATPRAGPTPCPLIGMADVRQRDRLGRIRLVLAMAFLGLGLAVGATARADPGPAPRLIDVSAAASDHRVFTVDGADFTAGGRVYLAIYDQMGARLYETRWTVATPALPVEVGPTGHEATGLRGGTVHQSFGQLCGATAMMRALDQATATWSNWVAVAPACGVKRGVGGA